MSQYLFFVSFFHFICNIFIFQLIFFHNNLLESWIIFLMDIEKPFTFYMVNKSIKKAITVYCRLITDPFPSYIFISFLFTLKFWIRIFGFPNDIVLSSLILCIRNSDLAHEKRRYNHRMYKKYFVINLSYCLFYTFL